MKLRDAQLALRLDGVVEDIDAWHEGRCLPYLGGQICLRLATDRKEAVRDDATLHLPLPPEADARQIQDAAEAWLRREAERLLREAVEQISSRLGVPAPALRLSFAARANWVRVDLRGLCCNWRLIEQPAAVIDQVLERTLSSMAPARWVPDLFAAA